MPRFRAPLSTVVEASDGSLLGARIAVDGQWRFPAPDSVPHKFEKALLTYEDRWFYRHPGINPVALFRALRMNIRRGEIVSGGSTLTMQVARIAGGNPNRTYLRKIVEMLSALRLELFRSKREILKMYVANAPFGGNVVGLEAAVWKYSGFSPYNMSWADAATYAVLPNSPALIHPGRNRDVLRNKRDRLLTEMHRRGYFDALTLELAREEPVIPEPHPLPADAPHLTDWFHRTNRGERVRTTIDPVLQKKATAIVNMHAEELKGNLIYNAACLIVSVDKGEVLAYVGNSAADTTGERGHQVDIIRSLRSTGSILKPLLYAGLLTAGEMLPEALLPDVPVRYPGFAPKNFDGSFAGAVPASMALARSLNIPSVKMLQMYTPARFHQLLAKSGITSFSKTAEHYGLSMILGGGEASLWELTGMYASMSRSLKGYNSEGIYHASDYHPPVLRVEGTEKNRKGTAINPLPVTAKNTTTDTNPKPANNPLLSAGAIWLTYKALREVNRPDTESGWQFTGRTPDVAWKTGTSFGFRDAWAVGTTPEYVIGIWVGNASGEGRPGLTGASSAGPILFDLISWLNPAGWFERPGSEELTLAEVCSESGYRAGPDCNDRTEMWVPVAGLKTEACPYHTVVHLNSERTARVNSLCVSPASIISESWFVLPPAMEYFYRRRNPSYTLLPPMASGCEADSRIPEMEFIYPPREAGIFIPRDHTGETTRFVAEVIHRASDMRVFWHLDDAYLGETKFIHQFEVMAPAGEHRLTAIDEKGNMAEAQFSIKK
jgi:penicillin-binding protein 1C